MPVSWRISKGIVFLESDEEAIFEEWRLSLEGALTSSDYRPGMGLVHDIRRMGRVPAAAEVLARVYFLARQMRIYGIKRWAIVATGGAAYGMGRIGEAIVDDGPNAELQFRVFRDLAEAEAWARPQ